ncbi:hypothetical protein NHX12_000129 [Muraenolepis orangiensis]|uniref:Uncharacterized protein n=1 Tax=Muraenolepis orangiensis TaxID=630683 RepID=A0A9Q0I2S6_9TELE|nr:hypothetical protein NHX12_000129 [Muraenolepis orangiensis]
MEKDFQSAPKRFWQTIRRLRRGKRGSIQAVYSKGGTLLTSTEEVIGRWKEHFEELLNPTNPCWWPQSLWLRYALLADTTKVSHACAMKLSE